MERINKIVSLEDARIRLSGCTIPVVCDSDDSLGKVYSDISGSTYVRIKTIARAYNKALNIIRNGIKLKRKSNLSDCVGVGSENKFIVSSDFEILPISCVNYDFGYSVYSTNSFIKITENEYETNLTITTDNVVLTDEFDEFERLGGISAIIKAYQYLFCGRKDGGRYVSPYIEIPLLLSQDIADIGHMTDYQDDSDDFPNEDGISVDTKFSSNVPNPLSASSESVTGYTTDSKLQFLRDKTIYTDDEGNVLPGVYSNLSANAFYRYTYHPNNNSITIARYNNASAYPCCDGEPLVPGVQKYRTASIQETAKRLLIDNHAPEGSYYFMIKNQNSSSENYRMKIPFTENPNGDGDRIIAIDSASTNGMITFVYVYNGIYYNETYKYETNQEMEITLDGFENIKIYYDKIDYDFEEQTIYNKHYGVNREGILTDITDYVLADVWGKDGSRSGETINAPVFKEEYLLGISSAFESEVDVTVNRGNAAAFEKHFKLSECNTMEDLEMMGNGGFFNL